MRNNMDIPYGMSEEAAEIEGDLISCGGAGTMGNDGDDAVKLRNGVGSKGGQQIN